MASEPGAQPDTAEAPHKPSSTPAEAGSDATELEKNRKLMERLSHLEASGRYDITPAGSFTPHSNGTTKKQKADSSGSHTSDLAHTLSSLAPASRASMLEVAGIHSEGSAQERPGNRADGRPDSRTGLNLDTLSGMSEQMLSEGLAPREAAIRLHDEVNRLVSQIKVP